MKRKNCHIAMLQRVVRNVYAAPNVHYALSLAEALVLETKAVQRMRRLRQTGLGYLAEPASENTRLPHCIGTAYWASEILNSIAVQRSRMGDRSPTKVALSIDELEDTLGQEISFVLVVKLFALVHDMALLPLNHTMRYQLGYYCDPQIEAHLFDKCINEIVEEIEGRYGREGPVSRQQSLVPALCAHLRFVSAVMFLRNLRGLRHDSRNSSRANELFAEFGSMVLTMFLVSDIVVGPLGGDILDYAGRDRLAFSMDTVDRHILRWYSIVLAPLGERDRNDLSFLSQKISIHEPVPRLAIRLDMEDSPSLVAAMISKLLRARLEIFDALLYSTRKLGFDALFDGALRVIDRNSHWVSQRRGPLSPEKLVELGDDEFLLLLESLENTERTKAQQPTHLSYAGMLANARQPTLIARLDASTDDPSVESHIEELRQPAIRDEKMRSIKRAYSLPLEPVVGFVPKSPQVKELDLLFLRDGRIAENLENLSDLHPRFEEVNSQNSLQSRSWTICIFVPDSEKTLGSKSTATASEREALRMLQL